MNKLASNIVWIDLEMTGLNPETDRILEIATIITDGRLTILEEGPSLVIHYDQLPTMDEWVRKTHEKSGLLREVAQSITSLQEAEKLTLSFIEQYCPPQAGIIAGNSVWQDRAFINRHMPLIDRYLNYRILDVSSVKEIVKRWYQGSPHLDFKKRDLHRAMPDIFESIEELRHYRTYFFITS